MPNRLGKSKVNILMQAASISTFPGSYRLALSFSPKRYFNTTSAMFYSMCITSGKCHSRLFCSHSIKTIINKNLYVSLVQLDHKNINFLALLAMGPQKHLYCQLSPPSVRYQKTRYKKDLLYCESGRNVILTNYTWHKGCLDRFCD